MVVRNLTDTVTPEQMEAGRAYIQVTAYKTSTTIDATDDAVRKLFAAPDSREKRHFLRVVGKFIESARATKAAEAAGLYDPSGLYAALCDLSEHLMVFGKRLGKEHYPKYCMPAVMMTSTEARAAANDIVAVVKLETGFDLMDPVGSLERMQKAVVV